MRTDPAKLTHLGVTQPIMTLNEWLLIIVKTYMQQNEQQQSVKDDKISQSLARLLSQLKPKARRISELHVQDYNKTIYNKIVDGDILLSEESLQIEAPHQKLDFEEALRHKFLSKAEKEKMDLEHRLGCLTNSINSIRKYDDTRSSRSPKDARGSFSGMHSRANDQQWRKQIRKRGVEIEKKKKERQEQRQRKEQELKQSMEKLKEQQDTMKILTSLKHINEIKVRAKAREQELKEEKQRYGQMKRQKRMFEKMSESYSQQEQFVLNERKKKLAEIRSLYHPINEEEIKEHEKWFMEQRKEKEQKRERERQMNESRSQASKSIYQSAFYKKNLDRPSEEDSITVNIQKKKQFSEHVKQCFRPQIDQKKRQQLVEWIEKERTKPLKQAEKEQLLLNQSRTKGVEYLQMLRDLPRDRKSSHHIQSGPKTDRIVYKNYLAETNSRKSTGNSTTWARILQSNQDQQSKAIKLHFYAQRYEQQLKRKEQHSRLVKHENPDQIDQQYFAMIKAKLDLMQDSSGL